MRVFLRRPRLPIREMYLTRVVINLVYFARNYLNVVLLLISVSAFMYPLVLVVLLSAGGLHLASKRSGGAQLSPAVVSATRVLQLVMCCYVAYVYGFFRLLAVNAIPMMLVAAHAALTPYTDDAMAHYEAVMAGKGFAAPAPRSPTKGYDNVDKMFAGALQRPATVEENDAEMARSQSALGPMPSPADAANGLPPSARLAATQPRSPTTPRLTQRQYPLPKAVLRSNGVSPTSSKQRLLSGGTNPEALVPASMLSEGASWISTSPSPSSLPLHVGVRRREITTR